MKTFYVTIAANMPYGPGYYKIHAPDENTARDVAFTQCPDGRWSFIYDSLDKVHPMDRVLHGVLGLPIKEAGNEVLHLESSA